MSRTLSCVFAGATAVVLASSPVFAATVPPAPAVPQPIHYSLYDRAADPATAAIKAAVADATKRGFVDKRDRAGLQAFYAQTAYAPAWTADGKLSDRALALIARLKQADADGLDADVYQTPDLALGTVNPASPQALAAADVLLSQAIITYAHQAHVGRLDPGSVSLNISYNPKLPDPVQVLNNVATADDPGAALASYNPTHPEFAALRDALAAARANALTAVKLPIIPAGNIMRLGLADPRVPLLRQRIGAPDPTPDPKTPTIAPDPKKFDAALETAVKAFQKDAGLNPDGGVGPVTLAALNAAADDHINLILANMERWRWMPEDMGAFYVRVNIPNYNLDVYKDGEVIWTTRIVVGKVENQTPIFSDEIEYADVNPVWNVPSSIAVKEMLPAILANPAVALAGYEVYYNANGRFEPINPLRLDWRRVDMTRIQIKQPPGEANALGSIKFMFPNDYSVYLHDTPAKSLFALDYRAQSHGCMRVQDPWGFADVLMTQEKGLTTAQLKKLVGGPETQVNFPTHIPVHITYFTAWVDSSGKLQVRNDVYGHDATVEKGLGLQTQAV
jgi:murein L,D-transpeptidase YcbB/YkuD